MRPIVRTEMRWTVVTSVIKHERKQRYISYWSRKKVQCRLVSKLSKCFEEELLVDFYQLLFCKSE